MLRAAVFAFALGTAAAYAQPRTIAIHDCNAPFQAQVKKDQPVSVSCDWAFIQSRASAMATEEQLKRLQEQVAVLEQYKTIADQLDQKNGEALDQAKHIIDLENEHYAALLAKLNESQALAHDAVQQTRKALEVANATKWASFASAGVLGLAAGGVVGYQISPNARGASLGAAVGLLGGAAVNFLILQYWKIL